MGTAVGVIVGALVGLGASVMIDSALLELEEFMNRDDFKREIIFAIRAARREFEEQYLGQPDSANPASPHGHFLFCKTWWCWLGERFLPARLLYAGEDNGSEWGLVRAGSVLWCRARRRGARLRRTGAIAGSGARRLGEAVKS